MNPSPDAADGAITAGPAIAGETAPNETAPSGGHPFGPGPLLARLKRLASSWPGRLAIVTFVAAVSLAAYLLYGQIDPARLSYGAVAAAVLIASGGLVVPVPALAITCGSAAFLNPAAVAVIAGLAGTLGELTGYFLGYSGSDAVRRGRFYQRMESWMRRRGWLILFIISAVPNPLFDIAGIAAGVLRYSLWRYLLAVGAGKQVKFFMVAYACHYGLTGLKNAFGI